MYFNLKFYYCLSIILVKFTSGYCAKIAYGQTSQANHAPYMISLQALNESNLYQHHCGGSILDKNWILTAGHCLHGKNVSVMRVFAGRHNIHKENEAFGQARNIKYFKVHGGYPANRIVYEHDIALIYVDEPFQFNYGVGAIHLPAAGKNHSGIATLYGWGRLENGTYPSLLQTADIPIIDNEEGNKIFGPGNVAPSHIAVSDTDGKSACPADSGGPLVQFNAENNTIELIGVVSYGGGCGIKSKQNATVFMRVSYFIDWINKVKQDYEATLKKS